MDERYYALWHPAPRRTSLDRGTLQSLLAHHQTRLAELKAEERGYSGKLNKSEQAYLWGAQEYAKATIREIKTQLGAGL